MSIDKESSGRPEFDVQRRTTKVNLFMIGGIFLFLAVAAVVAVYVARRSPEARAPQPTAQAPAP